ncbi:MAG: hypothetical protein AVDCRST_MAG91-3036 [uncultured Sphingomonadaceae bacterium]|uniref:Peptidase M28 domain-containing protein n=1 Tax=uncultured Sphingomonadaceae bacterium TaxID=169976 RepID=A0A6J4TV83_9SPHN|nr:MAG: hypothetical protein AVDCRST_MAG91-3036 [uncultured Sphingomonadaceae bacterium]
MSILLATLAAAAPLPAKDRVSEADLSAHIRILASDEYEGRKPGTTASAKTLSYIATAWARAGLRPGAADGGWYQPVSLVDRAPASTRLRLGGDAGALVPAADLVAIGTNSVETFDRTPLVEVSTDGTVPSDIAGKVAILRLSATNAGALWRQRQALDAVGAKAVLILTPDATFERMRSSYSQGGTDAPGSKKGVLIIAHAGRFDALRARAGRQAGLSGTITTTVRNYTSHNVVGRLLGRRADGEAVLITGHWDHLGLCRPEGAPDRICNGAIDNASGIAVMIEVAERLARGKRPARDVVFVATTAEESGLLGAAAYVDAPTVPLDKIVGVLNIDTIAIGPRGLPVSAVNRGNTAIDPLIDEAARRQRRPLDADLDANAFIMRQDGAVFTRAGVPAVMAGGSFADMKKLQAFLAGPYHGPDDEWSETLPLGGAAEDAELHVLLTRALADPRRYKRVAVPQAAPAFRRTP